jgi:hypothetical protein
VVTDFADRAANPQGNGVMTFEAFNSKNYPNSCIFQILPLNSDRKGKVVSEKYFNLSVNGKTLHQSQSTTGSCIYVTTQTGDVAQFSFGGAGITPMGSQRPLQMTNSAGSNLSYMTINSMTGGEIGSKGTIMYEMDTNCSPYGALWYIWDVAFYAATPGTPPPSVEPIYNRGCMTKEYVRPGRASLFKTKSCNIDQCIPEKAGIMSFFGLCPYHPLPTPSTPSNDNGGNSGSKTFQTTIKNVMYGVLIVFGLMILAVIIRSMNGGSNPTPVQEALELQKMSPTK